MILTITPSPTFDLTYKSNGISTHEVNRVGKKTFEPSGKGINVSINLAEEKFKTKAIAPIPENALGDLFTKMASKKINLIKSKTTKEIRINTSIVDNEGVTKINEDFEKLSNVELQELVNVIANEAMNEKPKWIALCGSVHPENAKFLGDYLRQICNEVGAKFALDTSGESAQVIFEFTPDFIKPNREELTVWYSECGKF
jgi:1-phosphofructokinase